MTTLMEYFFIHNVDTEILFPETISSLASLRKRKEFLPKYSPEILKFPSEYWTEKVHGIKIFSCG